MFQLNLPFYNLTLKEENGNHFIFDDIRKKYLRLTPEEWVRQNFVKYLIDEKKYPPSLIVIEKGLKGGKISSETLGDYTVSFDNVNVSIDVKRILDRYKIYIL